MVPGERKATKQKRKSQLEAKGYGRACSGGPHPERHWSRSPSPPNLVERQYLSGAFRPERVDPPSMSFQYAEFVLQRRSAAGSSGRVRPPTVGVQWGGGEKANRLPRIR